MSIAGKIRAYLADEMKKGQPNDEGWYPLDMDKMAKDLGLPRPKLGSHVSAIASKGSLKLIKDKNAEGMRGNPAQGHIVGFSDFDAIDHRLAGTPPVPKERTLMGSIRAAVAKAEAPPEPRPSRRLVPTPNLDRIWEAQSAMAKFVEQFPGLVDEARARASIQIDPNRVEDYANEGMSLLSRNAYLEERNRELGERVRTLERELGFKRAKSDQQLQGALRDSGVLVAHGD